MICFLGVWGFKYTYVYFCLVTEITCNHYLKWVQVICHVYTYSVCCKIILYHIINSVNITGHISDIQGGDYFIQDKSTSVINCY